MSGAAASAEQPEPDAVAARAEELSKVYGAGDARVVALDGVDISFAAGRFAAIMGPSGSGKSTLMHCMAGLDTPTSGRSFIGSSEITAMKDKALTRLRRDHVGFIFQSFNLLPTLTALENIALPADIAGRSLEQGWLDQIIDTVDLRSRLGHRPGELSGGQQQRVAVARALAGRPSVIFADNPPATSTPAPPPTCSSCWPVASTSSARASSWSPTTPWQPPTPTVRCSSPTARSSTTSRLPPPTPSSKR